ncbi:unnamed protein product [Heligmosomoides polygyrus]|uniref:Transposase n=1 Tax=Heligmosomoides polygyrus TaxID=6339 RepID=A0A183FEJ3_HELPZ|nr:unnamed protein product [Heligmosomoides polygyrus]
MRAVRSSNPLASSLVKQQTDSCDGREIPLDKTAYYRVLARRQKRIARNLERLLIEHYSVPVTREKRRRINGEQRTFALVVVAPVTIRHWGIRGPEKRREPVDNGRAYGIWNSAAWWNINKNEGTSLS